MAVFLIVRYKEHSVFFKSVGAEVVITLDYCGGSTVFFCYIPHPLACGGIIQQYTVCRGGPVRICANPCNGTVAEGFKKAKLKINADGDTRRVVIRH